MIPKAREILAQSGALDPQGRLRVPLKLHYGGIAPGVVRIQPDTKRPAMGWELAGPFYLARWLMNFSAHRGCTLLTEVAARHVEGRTQLLGRIPIKGNRFINLYEMN